MTVYALDPGPTHSALCVFHGGQVLECEHLPNADIRAHFLDSVPASEAVLAVEWIESMGLVVGKETFDTCFEAGRIAQAWRGDRILRVSRKAVKLYLCGSARAKDPNVSAALRDLVGPKGTKKAPGPTFQVSGHGWAALGVAVTAAAKLRGEPDLDAVVWNER